MKVLVLSTVRTRSSYLLDCLCKYYNLNNFYEHYAQLQFDVKRVASTDLFAKYQELIRSKTEQINVVDNVGVKIHPTNFINVFKYHHDDSYQGPWNINSINDFVNIDYYNFQQYDKVFILTRKNFIDLYCSWITGQKLNKLLYTKLERNLIEKNKTNYNIKLHPKIAKILLFDSWFLDNVKDYLNIDNNKITNLDYDTATDFVSKNFTNVSSQYLDTQFNYRELITNYQEIQEGLLQIQTEFQNEFEGKLFSE